MAYSSDDPATRLAAVRTAIGECLTAQSYSHRARGKQMALLRDLRAMEKDLMAEVQEAGNGGRMASLGIITRPT